MNDLLDLPSPAIIAEGIIDAVNLWRLAILGIFAVIGVALIGSGLNYGVQRQHNRRLPWMPVLLQPAIGMLLIFSGMNWYLTKQQIFQTDKVYTYIPSLFQPGELMVAMMVSEVARLVGITLYYVGWVKMSSAGLHNDEVPRGRVFRSSGWVIFGFLLAEHPLFLTVMANQFRVPSFFH